MRPSVTLLVLALLPGCHGGDGESPPPASAAAPAPVVVQAAPSPAPAPGPTYPARRTDLLTVTAAFGPLLVAAGRFTADARAVPWSSWWYPVTETALFHADSGLSPLEKYDLYMQRAHGQATHAAQYEEENLYAPHASQWEGLCDAWSAASLQEPEPTHGATLQGIDFGVADLKALLIKTYENTTGEKRYGQLNQDRRGDDYDDIYPDQFHKLLQTELFEQGRGFIIDRDPSYAIWNQPVYEATTIIDADVQDRNVFHVDTFVVWADDTSAKPDTVGTLPINAEYLYDLMGTRQPDGRLLVQYAEWTGRSRDDHPDFATLVPEKPAPHQSKNLELSTDMVQEILARALVAGS